MSETELAPQMACRQARPPIPRANRRDAVAAHGSIGLRITMQQTAELGEIKMLPQQVPATEIDDGAVTGLAASSR